MRYEEKRAEVQDCVEDAMDTIADEFDLEVTNYPYVLVHGRKENMDLESLNFRQEDKIQFANHYSKRRSALFHLPYVIYLGDLRIDVLTEEATHALHKDCSNHKIYAHDWSEVICLESLKEMVGFFGSKLLLPERKNIFDKLGDYAAMDQVQKDLFRKGVSEGVKDDTTFANIIVHQQGYGLGERLYHAYLDGRFSKRRIRNLFTDSLNRKNDATEKFWQMRRELWPVD